MTISKESAQAIGEAIDNAAGELPFGYEISLLIELGGICCDLICPDGEVYYMDCHDIDETINEAVLLANEIERNKNEAG